MDAFEDWRRILIALVFVLPRMLVAFALLPVFTRQSLPGMTRNGVAVSLSLVILPMVMVDAPAEPPDWLDGLAILAKEAFIGLLIGFGAAIPFWVIASAGFFIDNQRGTTMASSIDPMTGDQSSPLGVFMSQVLAVLFFVGGGITVFLAALYESYRLWPVFSFFPRIDPAAIPWLLRLLDHFMALTVLLAAPVIIAMFLAEFALGLVSRFAPQMNVFSLAMPIKSAVGMLILVIYLGTLFGFMDDELLAIGRHFALLEDLFR
ncbi:Type III secretion inner membrane protein [Imhoffiella purpurea]|uniref:Type III secretion inner membrane protein n=1 Tax=Imhoffiella purpurea TaxID=1249627 RepID=W9VHW1_9GAMM|nr:Type III secretion inner membrane protein [Imhoffiella purpurea]